MIEFNDTFKGYQLHELYSLYFELIDVLSDTSDLSDNDRKILIESKDKLLTLISNTLDVLNNQIN